MKEIRDNNVCSHGGDMLAYLYDEISSPDREAFELHLADCGTCIDVFAELSQSRYPVLEWKQLDFDPLETPQIAIPYRPASFAFLDRLTAPFGFGRTLGFAGATAAVLLSVTAGYFLLTRPQSSGEIAREVRSSPSPVASAMTPSPNNPSAMPVAIAPSNENSEPRGEERIQRSPEPVRTSTRQMKTAKPAPSNEAVKRKEPLPVLSTAEDYEDDSLRLADLFEDIETSE